MPHARTSTVLSALRQPEHALPDRRCFPVPIFLRLVVQVSVFRSRRELISQGVHHEPVEQDDNRRDDLCYYACRGLDMVAGCDFMSHGATYGDNDQQSSAPVVVRQSRRESL